MDSSWLCVALGVMLVILLIVTVVGHGIWVAVAAVFGPPKPRGLAGPSRIEDLMRTAAQVEELARANLIDPATCGRVLEALKVYRENRPPPIPVLPIGPIVEQPNVIESSVTAVAKPHAAVIAAAVPTPLPIVPPQPRPPRRSFSDVFAGFMRDSNIRWGELVGGMLIVGCSVALVISFWTEIEHHSFLQFGIFTSVTAAMLGVGLYAEHRWKLPTTSRGILLIATLLVPLNFLAFAALSHGARPSAVETAIEIAALALFGFLIWRAALVLAPHWPKLLTFGVGGISATLLAVQHVGPAPSAVALFGLPGAALIIYAIDVSFMLARASRWRHVRQHTAEAIYLLLGVLTFAAALAVGLVVFQATDPWDAARRLSPLISLAATPALASGLLVWRKITDVRLSKTRTAGTAIAVAAALAMLGAIALAWPNPASMLPLALADFIVLTAIAFAFAIPVAHALATFCLLLAYLTGFHVAWHHIGWRSTGPAMMNALISPPGGTALVLLCGISALAAALLRRFRRDVDAGVYRWFTGVVAIASVALVSWDGFGRRGDPYGTTWVYLVYAVAAFAAAWRVKRQAFAWTSSVLLIAASVQYFITRNLVEVPWSFAFLAAATVQALAGILPMCRAEFRNALRGPLLWAASFAAAGAVLLLIPHFAIANTRLLGFRLAWVCGIWFMVAVCEESEAIFVAAQVILSAAVTSLAISGVSTRAWFVASGSPLLEPWTLQSIGVALGILTLSFGILRLLPRRRLLISAWLRSAWSFDRALVIVLTAGLAMMLIITTLHGAAGEFAGNSIVLSSNAWSLHATGVGAWVIWVLLLVVIGIWIVDQPHPASLVHWLIVAALVCPLLAGHWMEQSASGSALRWSLAIFLVPASVPLWVREPLHPKLMAPAISRQLRQVLALVCVLPILILSLYPAALILDGQHMPGPAAGSIFARMGNSLSYLVPMAVVALALIVNAVRERSSGWAFAASGVCNLAVTLAYLLATKDPNLALGLFLVRLVQLNVISLALFAMVWLVARRLMHADSQTPPLLSAQIVLAMIGSGILLIAAAGGLFVTPVGSAAFIARIGSPIGWLSLAMTVAAWGGAGRYFEKPSATFVATACWSVGLMAAFASRDWDRGNWLSFHVMLVSAVLAAIAVVGSGVLIRTRRRGIAEAVAAPAPPIEAEMSQPIALQYQRQDPAIGVSAHSVLSEGGQVFEPSFLLWTALLTVWTVVLALRAMLGDPQRPWWSSDAMLVECLLWVGVSCWILSPALLYAAAALLVLGTVMWWVERPLFTSTAPLDLTAVIGGVLALFGVCSVVLHVHVFSKVGRARLPMHRFAAMSSTIIVVCLGAAMVFGEITSPAEKLVSPQKWGALGATALLLTASLADVEVTFTPVALYLVGLAAVTMSVSQAKFAAAQLAWGYEVSAAGFVLLSSMIYGWRSELSKLLSAVGMPLRENVRPVAWLAMANSIVGLVVIALAAHVDFTINQFNLRIVSALAALVAAVGLTTFAGDDKSADLRQAIILLAAAGAVVFAWAWESPTSATPVERAVAALLAISVLGLACGSIVVKQGSSRSSWFVALWSMLPVLVVLWGLNAITCLGLEIWDRASAGTVHAHGWAVGAECVALPIAAALAVALALREGEDPLGIGSRFRSGYVYASEALLAMSMAHLRLTMPWLFGGILSQYWPLLVMGLAFAGVGLGEAFRRRNVGVLSEPLERTGIFLPLLPVLAFWLAPSRIDFSSLLFVVGFFYAVLSATRKSFFFGVVAAFAANGGLWALLYRHPELRFLVHPQLWMIPAALSVLIAAQLNRDRLAEPQLRFIRYACLMIVYVSSTADIFLNGVRDHPWLPIVLAALSVSGVLVGMLFHLRAFLFLGTSFLAISIVTMIYYASANLHWTWLWYVAGIALGAGIIVVFALFEKKRAEMLALVDGLKQWQ